MLLRGKYDVLINVAWDCFDQSNFYISRINIIEWNNIFYPAMTTFSDHSNMACYFSFENNRGL